jgi:hypothetical protein
VVERKRSLLEYLFQVRNKAAVLTGITKLDHSHNFFSSTPPDFREFRGAFEIVAMILTFDLLAIATSELFIMK